MFLKFVFVNVLDFEGVGDRVSWTERRLAFPTLLPVFTLKCRGVIGIYCHARLTMLASKCVM